MRALAVEIKTKRRRPPPANGKSRRRVGGKRQGAGRWGSAWLQCSICQHPERSRIDYLVASGTSQRAVAKMFGVLQQYISRHFASHVTDRYKQLVSASHNPSFEKLLEDATAANSESVDTLNLIIRGHMQMWGVALEAADHQMMRTHSGRVLEALQVRAKITLELAPTGNITVNNYVMRDAAELANTLRGIEGAAERVEEWYRWRTQGRLIEAAAEIDVEAAE